MEKFDLVVIGGGPGGYPAAIRAAQLGAKVALVEREALGGTCLNWGCIPTKTLIASGDLFFRMRHAEKLGLKAAGVEADYAALAQRKDAVVGTLRNGVTQLLKGNGVKVYSGTAAFTARNRVRVSAAAGAEELELDRAIIATGAESTLPGFLPKSERIVESRAYLGLSRPPPSLLILGGGVIGCEFACLAAQLGTAVTIVELLPEILAPVDADIRRVLRQHMEKTLGIRILTGVKLEGVQAGNSGVKAQAGEQALEAEMLLVSIGRRPVTQGLGLETLGLEPTKTGHIPVDETGRTKLATVYAIGDVTAGSTQLAHAATAQGLTAAENALRGQRRKAETLVPACIFTAPEIGAVGLTESKAAEMGVAVKTGKFAFTGLGKALAMGETDGFVKWVADAQTEQLLGAHAIGPHATELIAEAALAIRAELTVAEVARTIHCHPTLAESWMEAAHAVHGTCIHAAPKKKTR